MGPVDGEDAIRERVDDPLKKNETLHCLVRWKLAAFNEQRLEQLFDRLDFVLRQSVHQPAEILSLPARVHALHRPVKRLWRSLANICSTLEGKILRWKMASARKISNKYHGEEIRVSSQFIEGDYSPLTLLRFLSLNFANGFLDPIPI